MASSVYIHIPFCNRICPYCDFNKYVLKGQPVEEYLDALAKEMKLTVQKHPPKEIKTIFVGGGTPTTLDPKQMDKFLDSIHQYLQPQTKSVEFTMEANPESMTEELLQVMKEGGVNRLSIGVQTFDPALLKKLGRLHTGDQVLRGIEIAQKLNYSNISIDLMFGLPGQTLEGFEQSISTALGLGIQHVSAYGLKIEEGTFFHTLYRKDKLPLPTEDEEVSMYDVLMEKMDKAGFKQYEISNFAFPGFESRHNLTYWRNQEYYGLGAGAHGYIQGQRHVNAGPLQEYLTFLNQDKLPYVETHSVSKQESMEDMMIMGLRTAEGVSEDHFVQRYGLSLQKIYGAELNKLTQEGLLLHEGNRYFLSKQGKFIGNEVFATFLREDSL